MHLLLQKKELKKMSMDQITPEAFAGVRPLQSPEELGPLPHVLGKGEHMVIADFGVGAEYPKTTWEFEDGRQVEGQHVMTVTLGGEEEFATVDIVDLRHNPMIAQGEGYYRQAGRYEGGPLPSSGNFATVVKDKEGRPRNFRALTSERMWNIGRAEGALGNEWLPGTVSRDHLAIGVNIEGKLVVENHQPTNKTTAEKPPIYEAPEYKYRPQTLAIDTINRPDSDMSLSLDELAPVSPEAETREQLGIAGEVVGNVLVDHGMVDALLVRRQTSEGTFRYSLVRKVAGDGSLKIVGLEAGKPTTLENEEDHEGSIVAVEIDDQGVLHLKEIRRWILNPDSGANRMHVRKAKSPYVHASAKLPEKPVPYRPQRYREAQMAMDPRTGNAVQTHSLDRR